MPIKILLLKKS